MPIGFSDLLKTTAQFDNGLTKGIVSTDDTYGGVRSHINDWTDLHLRQFTLSGGGTAYTFQDAHTASSPGHFKEYSTLFYVADGRKLIQDDNATENFIILDENGYQDTSGTKYVAQTGGTEEPEYWVLFDRTQTGGTSAGRDALPKFTISSVTTTEEINGVETTVTTQYAIPSGYQKLQVLTNAAPSVGGDGYNTVIGVDETLTTTGAQVIDTIVLDDGVVTSNITTRNLTASDVGINVGISGNNVLQATNTGNTLADNDFLRVDGTKIEGLTAGELKSALSLTASDVGLGSVENAQASTTYLALAGGTVTGNTSFNANLTFGDANSDTVTFNSKVASNVIPSANDTYNLGATNERWNELHVKDVIIDGDLTLTNNPLNLTATDVTFADSVLELNVPDSIVADIQTDSGFRFGRSTSAASTLSSYAGLLYLPAQDAAAADEDYTDGSTTFNDFGAFRFTPFNQSTTASSSDADNVLALKFDHTDTNTQVSQTLAEQDDTTITMDAADEANAESKRSLGAVSRCRVDITALGTNGDDANLGAAANTNYAPDIAWEAGYPVKHNLASSAVFVVAIKDPDGTPVPLFPRYEVVDNATVRVFLGKTANNEIYDVLVIG